MINTLLWPLEDYDCMKFKSLKFKSSTCNEIIIHPKHLMRFVGHGYWMDPQFGFSAGLFVLRWLGLWKSSPTASLRTEDTVNFLLCPEGCTGRKRCLRGPKVSRPDRVSSLSINPLQTRKKQKIEYECIFYQLKVQILAYCTYHIWNCLTNLTI